MKVPFDQNEAKKCIVQVQVSDKDEWARGFITRSGKVMTAGHCLPELPTSDPENVHPTRVKIKDLEGLIEPWTVDVVFVDPCQDVAVLERTEYPTTTMHVCESGGEGLCIELEDYKTEFDVFIFTHENNWLSGKGTIATELDTRIFVELDNADDPVNPGTSGSPIFSSSGHVVGIVSTSTGRKEVTGVWLPNSLPLWLVKGERAAIDEDEN